MLVRAIVILLGVLPVAAWAVPAADAGRVRFFQVANTAFDRYTQAPSPERQAWMRARYWRVLAYAPYFDRRLAWFPDAWVYKDLYAIPVDGALAMEHPEWILRDRAGARLYVRYRCTGTACPQYATDVGDPAFRTHWIAAARALLAPGYRGLFVDDVNMLLSRVSDGAGRAVSPVDPRTGREMTEADWRRHVADFATEIRDAFPGVEIVHNVLWPAGRDGDAGRALLAADFVNLERGVDDDGIRGGPGRYGVETLLDYIDWLHAHDRGVLLEGEAVSARGREYGLAFYLLISSGRDALRNDVGGTPDDWWPGYQVDLGAPAASRREWSGLLRRDFAAGVALVNPPGASVRTVTLDAGYVDLAGAERRTVRLGPAEGVVLRRQGAGSDG